MAGGADLFVVCKKCGSEVSPYITECPYCGARLRKRAPKIEREDGDARPAFASLGPLRHGEIPGIKGDRTGRPYATLLLISVSLFGFILLAAIPDADVAQKTLWGDQPWRLATASFAYNNVWYELVALLSIGIFGWLLESRHGPLAVIAVFLICGLGGNALGAQFQSAPFLLGAPGAALGMLAAWVVPDLRRARKNIEYDGDLLGTLVIAVAIGLMPAAVAQCSPVGTAAGGVAGLLIGHALSHTRAAR